MFIWKRQSELTERMDPSFWDPEHLRPLEHLHASGYPLRTIRDLAPFLTYGPIVVGKGMPDAAEGPLFIDTSHFQPTGFAPLTQRVPAGSEWDVPRCHVRHGDVLIVRSGVATVGRTLVYLGAVPAIVGCYVDILRQYRLDPCYLCLFLKSTYGQCQIRRFHSGVGTLNLSFDQIRSIVIPELPRPMQRHLAQGYHEMYRSHEAGDRDLAHQQLDGLILRLDETLRS